MSVFRPIGAPKVISLGTKSFSFRCASSAASSRWKARQSNDPFTREAKTQGLRSRAAFKLLEIDKSYRIFRRGNTVVDLGFAPGSWSQVAVDKISPGGIVVGIDLLPAAAPSGAVVLQGDFLAPHVREKVKTLVIETKERARMHLKGEMKTQLGGREEAEADVQDVPPTPIHGVHERSDRPVVDVVISDMMMNTSGIAFRDHVGSMDLCEAALMFAQDTLRTGGHFVCKFYQGSEDKAFELKLKTMFTKVFREKPDSSRKVSKESYFVALKRKRNATKETTTQGIEH